MKKVIVVIIAVNMLLLWSGISFAGTKAVMDQVCSLCHKVSRPLNKKKDRAGWEATVKRMATKTNKISAEQQNQIIDFLSKVRNINTKVQAAKDPANLTDMEKLHLAKIDAPASVKPRSKVAIKVQIGQKPHPMTKDHYIYAVDLYVNNRWEAMVELEPGQTPEAVLNATIYVTFPIEVITHCTKDGSWSVKSEIKAEK